MEHLEQMKEKHSLLKEIEVHERQTTGRLGKEFIQRRVSYQECSNVKQGSRKEHEERRKRKVTHGYLQKRLEKHETIDMKKTNSWLGLKLSSHIEGFMASVQKQEPDTKETRKRREKNQQRKKEMDTKRRICQQQEESVYHLICSCPVLAPTLYLESRHNQIAKIIYQEILEKDKLEYKPPPITKAGNIEIWWDEKILTHPMVEKNRPDLVIWNTEKKLCKIVEITVPLDTNLATAYKEKERKYIQLISAMQQQYTTYKFSTVIIIVGGMGAIPKNLENNIKKSDIEMDRVETIIKKLQKAAVLGSVKICKTVLNM